MNIVTRSDFDGLCSAMLLKQVEIIDEVRFAHPRDVQQGDFMITPADIIVNLPYHRDCGMWFDHHSSEKSRDDLPPAFEGRCEMAPSAARVVANYYKSPRFDCYKELLAAVDKVDSADLTVQEVANAEGWILLGFIMDPRTGLGKFHDYAMSNRELMYKMIEVMATHRADEILKMYDVRQRVDRYNEEQDKALEILREKSKLDGNCIVTDMRGAEVLPTGNRFLIYTLYPDANINVYIQDGRGGENVAVAIGHSIFNDRCRVNVGRLLSKYGGGGHKGAGGCTLDAADADRKIRELLNVMRENRPVD